MIELNQYEKSMVGGCWCEDGNKCFPWNKVNNQTEIDFSNLWCLQKDVGVRFCANTICCTIPSTMGKSYDGYTYHGDVFVPEIGTIRLSHTESGYCGDFNCK